MNDCAIDILQTRRRDSFNQNSQGVVMKNFRTQNCETDGLVLSKPGRMLRLPEVLTISGLARSTVYKYIAMGLFPKQTKICGGRCSGWAESEVMEAVKNST
jgi:prophage regulatory protein